MGVVYIGVCGRGNWNGIARIKARRSLSPRASFLDEG
jgi:hypothetical protein